MKFTCDHLHLRSLDPEKGAQFYVEMFGAAVLSRAHHGETLRVVVDLGGLQLFIEQVPPQTPVPPSPHVPAAVPAPVAVAAATLEKPPARGVWPFDPLAEKPIDRFTLSQKAREVNDVIGANATSSLNDKLKSDVSDLKSALNDTPVRDLRKAIGVNDRYVFINQLFRGDEVMYERSLKTINGFRILPEAEYWMERELKVKLGWDENREITRHFYQLVKRRFS